MVLRNFVFGLILLFFIGHSINAQKRNNIWAFGDGVGLNFNTIPVSLFKSQSAGIPPPYYISSICSKSGDLLFYTDGITVWNRDGFKLPKYNNWWPWFGNVMPLITPHISNDSLYYFFGIDNEDAGGAGGINSSKLQYFTIKMYNPGDIEEAVYPRPSSRTSFYKTLLSNTSHALTGTIHCNQRDMWIVTHSPGALYAFLITKDSVENTPVVTPVSEDILPLTKLNLHLSNIKFSANSEKLIIPDSVNNRIVVFDFDNQTGKFSNPLILTMPAEQYLEDIEISADASKLYFGAYEVTDSDAAAELHYIYQMDLNAGSQDAIQKSIYKINIGDRVACVRSCTLLYRTMQLGPDGKIYCSRKEYKGLDFETTMGVIDDPSKPGVACHYTPTEIDLKKKYKFLNYNYIRSASFTPAENSLQYKSTNCFDEPVEFSLIFNRIDSVRWDFGDSLSGNNNFSLLHKPLHQYPQPGTYTVKAIIYDRCFSDTASAEIIISENKSLHLPALKDTSLCNGESFTVDATSSNAKVYRWENGSFNPQRTIDKSGTYTLTVMNDCSIESKSFTATFTICPCTFYIPNAFTPNYDGLNDEFKAVFGCNPLDYQFKIFDRFGSIIFQSKKYKAGWNGKNKQEDLPIGIYVWILQYRHPGTKELIQKKGTVTLLR